MQRLRSGRSSLLLAFAFAAFVPVVVRAETTATDPIEVLTVIAPRVEQDAMQVPAAISQVKTAPIQLARPQISLEESLSRVPGLFIQGGNNFAQDLRISIRGFGARSNFGIRGIRVVVDGIPATLPDGQSQVDNIDLGSTRSIEVLRGPSSALYGPSSGGVIRIESERGSEVPYLSARVAAGADGYQRYQAKAGGRAGAFDYLASLSHLHYRGYREHAQTRNILFNGRFGWEPDETSDLDLSVGVVHAPVANDPGGLTQAEVDADRRQASARNLSFDAGEAIDQQQFGLRYRKRIGDWHGVEATSYYVWRQFDNRLPFSDGGDVELNRFVGGGGLRYLYDRPLLDHENQLLLGVDIDAQRDHRERFDNLEGDRGARTFDQEEDVTSYGVYLQDEFRIVEDVELTLGVRYDRVVFDVDDDFDSDGSDDGRRHFDAWSPRAGIVWNARPYANLFANVSTGFETPTTTELANPDGSGGFNPDLDAQRSVGVEAGVQGLLPDLLRYQLVGFYIDVEDELIPFEVPSMPGRDFFENAGSSKRGGLEASFAVQPCAGFTTSFAYTYSHFEFDRFRTAAGDFDGNRIPGIPRHQVWGELAYAHPTGFYAAWEISYVSGLFADNANSVKTDPFTVSNLRAGWTGRLGAFEFGPFVGFDNLWSTKYADNVRLNAAFGRYFEPAATFSVYGGLSLGYHFGGP